MPGNEPMRERKKYGHTVLDCIHAYTVTGKKKVNQTKLNLTDLPFTKPPKPGRMGGFMEASLNGGDTKALAPGVDEGFLKGRLGRTDIGVNDRFMSIASKQNY